MPRPAPALPATLCMSRNHVDTCQALSIARELKIYEMPFVAKKVQNFNTSVKGIYTGMRSRMIYNYQRTWLCIFLLDRQFELTMGRTARVSWREVTYDVASWPSRVPTATSMDKITAVNIQLRILLVRAVKIEPPPIPSIRQVSADHLFLPVAPRPG